MAELGPQVVASSVVWNTLPVFNQMLADIEAGEFANKYYQLGVAENVVQVEVNPAVKEKLGDETLQAIEETRAQIASGQLEVPFVPPEE